MKGKFHNVFKEDEPGLHSILTEPKIGIGQRAFLVRTPKGNVQFDCVPQLDEDTAKAVKALGGIAAVAVSHPHYYTTMVEWSHAFGKVPVHIHEAYRPKAVEVAKKHGVDFGESDLSVVKPEEGKKPARAATAHWAPFTFSGVRPAQ